MLTFAGRIRKYPLTVLIIICWIGGIVYFGSLRLYEKVDEVMNRAGAVDILNDAAEITESHKTRPFLSLPAQNTEEIKAAREAAAKKAEEERMKNPFSKVDLSYLDDALFIGDSRTETLRLYAGWDDVTFYSKTGTNIWSIMEEEIAKDPDSGEKISVEAALKKQHFGKIYIMLGINELGTGTPESFYQQFKSVVKQIRDLQPDAILFVQSIIHVSKVQDGEGSVVNNENVNARNKLLQKLADNKMIYYLDGNEVLDDGDSCLNGDYTFDGIHLTADHVDVWTDYILAHGVVLEQDTGNGQKASETEAPPETEAKKN